MLLPPHCVHRSSTGKHCATSLSLRFLSCGAKQTLSNNSLPQKLSSKKGISKGSAQANSPEGTEMTATTSNATKKWCKSLFSNFLGVYYLPLDSVFTLALAYSPTTLVMLYINLPHVQHPPSTDTMLVP